MSGYDFHNTTRHVSRKITKCEACGYMIEEGDTYLKLVGRSSDLGEFYSLKIHESCPSEPSRSCTELFSFVAANHFPEPEEYGYESYY